MEEKILEGKFIGFKDNKYTKSCIFGTFGLLILSLILGIITFYTEDTWSRYLSRLVPLDYKYDHFGSYFISSLFFEDGFENAYYIILFYLSIVLLIAVVVMYFLMNKCSITITNTRITGKASFGKQVDLPLSQISAIGLGMFGRLSVATSSGRIHFWLLDNRDELHNALSEQLGKFQKNVNDSNNYKNDTAENLKKFKELLDEGVITQEEFDAKKKELLGL